MNLHSSPYYEAVIKQIPRLLSQMDREPLSQSFGGNDRTYWGWKFTDFAGPRFQESLYTLAWLYANPIKENYLYKHPLVLRWIGAGFQSWIEMQHDDGSFDEAYPYERSMAATAFTGFYLGEAFLKVKKSLPKNLSYELDKTFRRVGKWLCKNQESHGFLSNHLAAASAALTVISSICQEPRFSERANHFLQLILNHQSDEGWYEEYGGADLGYQTHGSFYLARIWQLTANQELLSSLKRSIKFLSVFVHPNVTLGGEYGSRNTSFYFPAAFEMLASEIEEAQIVANFMRSSINTQSAAGLSAMDAYNFCPMINNYLFAHDSFKENNIQLLLPHETSGKWYFEKAGLFVKSTPYYYAVFAPSKGGVLKIYNKLNKTLAYSDCGYWGKTENGTKYSSQGFSLNNKIDIFDNIVTVRAPFFKVNQKLMSPLLFVGFRIFMITFGRFPKVSTWLKKIIVKILVSGRKPHNTFLIRKIEFQDRKVFLKDRIEFDPSSPIKDLTLGAKFATIHMGSARYFQYDELDSLVIDCSAKMERVFKYCN